MKALKDAAIRTLGLVAELRRIGRSVERSRRKERDHPLVELAKGGMERRSLAGSKLARVGGPGIVVDESCPGLGDPLVAKRDHEGARARGGRDDPGAESNPLLAPDPDRVEVVGERAGIAARRGDEKLDLGVEIDVDERLDAGDELVARGPVELAHEEHEGVVLRVYVGNFSHRSGPTSAMKCTGSERKEIDKEADGRVFQREPSDADRW